MCVGLMAKLSERFLFLFFSFLRFVLGCAKWAICLSRLR